MAEAAVTALGVGASVVSFIGLAGQILQGCHYISSLFDDIKDAPENLSYLGAEIKAFCIVLYGFQQALQSVGQSTNIDAASEQVLTALKTSNATIKDLKALLDKYAHSGKRDWWKILKVAVLRSTFEKYCDRLGKAKIDILLAQSSIILIINVSHRIEMQNLLDSISSLNDNFLENTTTITSTTDISEQSGDASANTNNAISALTTTMVERMDARLFSLGNSFKVSQELALRDFLRDLRDLENGPRNETFSKWKISQSSADNMPFGTGLDAIRQTKCERKLSLVYANITISSITSSREVRDLPGEDNSEPPPNIITTRTKVDMCLPPWLTQLGLMVLRESRPSSSILGYSKIRLHVYRFVRRMSPIVQDCFAGEVSGAYYLFITGRASPYDIAISDNGISEDSLLDIAWMSWLTTVRKINHADKADTITRDLWQLKKEYEMFAFLVFSGLDPGVPRRANFGSIPRIWELINEAYSSRPALTPYLIDMARFIISSASTNPFKSERALFHDMVAAAFAALPEFHSCVYHQETWPLPEDDHHRKTKDPVDRRFLDELFTIVWSSGHFSLNPYSFDRDPDACYLKCLLSLFQGIITNSFHLDLCIKSGKISQACSEDSYDFAVQQRVVACLEAGMEFTSNPWVMVASRFQMLGKLEILRNALLRVGQDPGIIDNCLEIEARSILVGAFCSCRDTDSPVPFEEATIFTNLARFYRFCRFGLIKAGSKIPDRQGKIGGIASVALAKFKRLPNQRVSSTKATVRRKLWRSIIEPNSNFSIPLNVRNCLNRDERPGMFLSIDDSLQSLLERSE